MADQIDETMEPYYRYVKIRLLDEGYLLWLKTAARPLNDVQEAVLKLNQSGLRQKDIAAKLSRSQSHIHRILCDLEAQGHKIKRLNFKPFTIKEE